MTVRKPLVVVGGQVQELAKDDSLKGQSPIFTYTAGNLTQIMYADGSFKTFTYTNSLLTRVDYTQMGAVLRKDFEYVNGQLVSITESYL